MLSTSPIAMAMLSSPGTSNVKKYQTISIYLKDFELSDEKVVNEKLLNEYLKGVPENKVRSFNDWLIGPTYDGSELFMWRLVK